MRKLFLFSIGLQLTGIGMFMLTGLSWIGTQQASAYQPVVAIENTSSNLKRKTVRGTPIHIVIKDVGIDVKIRKGDYDSAKGSWTITDEAAYFALISSPINSEKGSTFVYGHNSPHIFGKLLKAEIGSITKVHTDNNYEFRYVLRQSKAVAPSDVEAVTSTGEPQLILQTCSGLWNEKRQLLYFDLVSYEKV